MKACERCGAQPAGFMDIDFRCNKRRCPLRGILDAKELCAKVAAEGNEPPLAKREALKILFDVMLVAMKDPNMTPQQAEEIARLGHGGRMHG